MKVMYPKALQTSKTVIDRKVCIICKKTREVRFFSSKLARVCGDCKKRGWRIKKQSAKGYITKKLDDKLRAEILIRDNYECQKCKGTKTLQMSHVYTKKAHPELRHNPDNVKILCHRCHFYWWHREPMDARDWFKAKFPDRYKRLRSLISSNPLES